MHTKLTKLLLRAMPAGLLLVGTALLQAQEPERIPSGDLSDFFNPPGIKTEGVKSTTRALGSGKLADATKPKTKADRASDKTPMAETKTSPKPKETGSEESASTGNSTGRVKIESEEVGEIEGGISFGEQSVVNWRVGVVMVTGSKPVRNVICRIPVPVQWPEQTVSVHEEELPSEITDISWEDLGNIKMMRFRISDVAAGEKLIGLVTFRVSTSQIIAPKNTSIFRIPKKRVREIRSYFGESPEISLRDTKMKKQAKALFDNGQSDWVKVEGLFDWIRANIEERAGDAKGSVDTFRDKSGNGEDRVSLFVAMCRINKVPARMVFVDGSQYAEFYLVDQNEKGHWFPCNVTGIREFGAIGEPRAILQKGDSYRVAGEKKKLKFVPAKATVKGSKPKIIKFVREPLSVK